MARSVTLRPWQKAALERLRASGGPDFLAVATPGAGKTTLALTAARHELAASPGRRLVIVVPTAHLKVQWARAAAAFDLQLDPQWTPGQGRLPADVHGVATTYQQVAGCAPLMRTLAADAFVVLDEVHHAADDRAWGDAIKVAFQPAARRLALSGTPFRSDTSAIPFVHYAADEAVADFEYGYGDALRDGGVVRPILFPRIDGRMEWSAPDGKLYEHGFDDPLDAARSSERLRTALSLDGEWLPAVLHQAHGHLRLLRERQRDAGGLVIATDQDHARGIARILRDRLGVRAVVATSDDPEASAHIARFAGSDAPWIVAVRMVSEGVDIPRLRVGVFATTTTTELFFRQAVGRLVRWTPGTRGQKSFLYIPDEPRLRARAFAIAEQRRHSLRSPDRDGAEAEGLLDRVPVSGVEAGDDQLSLFAPSSSVAVGEGADAGWAADDEAPPPDPVHDAGLTVALPPLPRLAGGVAAGADGAGAGAGGLTQRERKQQLREANADRARRIARQTGIAHAQVNTELNRIVGLTRITEATVEQLERRLERAEHWLRQASAPRSTG